MENPYLNSRREWNERYGDYIKQKNSWQIIAVCAIGLNAILGCALAYVASQSRVQPFAIEVDKFGNVSYPVPFEKLVNMNDRIVKNQLADYITSARSVTSDMSVQKTWLDKIYRLSSPISTSFLNEYYRTSDPFQKGRRGVTVVVEMNTLIPMSKELWQAEWSEIDKNQDGSLSGRSRWKAVIATEFFAPKTAGEMIANPSGLSIKSLSWSQEL
jgi:type IV secretion system protein VirB5